MPGWTARGHAGHWGYGWYRIRVQVAAMPGEDLALAGSADVDDAYQLFSNGSSDRQLRQLYRHQPTFYYTQPMMFNLPPAPAANGQNHSVGRVVLFGSGCRPSRFSTRPMLEVSIPRRCWAMRTRFRPDTSFGLAPAYARANHGQPPRTSLSSCSPSSPSA